MELPKGLLIYTDNDRYIDISSFDGVTNLVENLQTSFIKSASHFIHQRKHEDVNREMSKFLGIEEVDDPGQGKSVPSDDTKA